MPGMSVSTGATNVQSTSYHAGSYELPQRLTELPDFIDGGRDAAVLRRRPAVPVGALGSADVVTGRRLVRARDVHDAPLVDPCLPGVVGRRRSRAPRTPVVRRPGHRSLLVTGRAVRPEPPPRPGRHAWPTSAGAILPLAPGVNAGRSATVFDGRVGHDVPTVHIVSDNVVRGAAGSTTEAAYRRALFGDRGATDVRDRP